PVFGHRNEAMWRRVRTGSVSVFNNVASDTGGGAHDASRNDLAGHKVLNRITVDAKRIHQHLERTRCTDEPHARPHDRTHATAHHERRDRKCGRLLNYSRVRVDAYS